MSNLHLPGDERSSRLNSPALWVLVIIGIVIVIAVFVSCQGSSSDSGSGSGSGSGSAASSGEDSKYAQTWPKSYSDTTCSDWTAEMSPQQRFAGAADMLTSARNKGDEAEGLPPDALISEFEDGITNVCVVPTMSLAEVAVGLYLTEDRFRP